MKLRKRTPEMNARISEVVEIRMKDPTNAELGRELGLSTLYVAQLISAEIRRRRKLMVEVKAT